MRRTGCVFLLPMVLALVHCGDAEGLDAGGADGGARVDAARPDDGGSGGRDAGGDEDGGPLDGGTEEPDAGFAPLEMARRYTSSVPFLVRDAETLSDGWIVAGTSTADFAAGENREALAVAYDAAGAVRWARRFGTPQNDQFFGAGRRASGEVVLAGLTRQGSPSTDDILLVEAGAEGPGRVFRYGTSAEDQLFGIVPGGSVAAWIGVGNYAASPSTARDGLIVAFDANLAVSWAARFDSGSNELFLDAVVDGDVIYAVGRVSADRSESGGRALVVAMNATSVLWARASMTADTTAVAVTLAPGADAIAVAGSLGAPAGPTPAVWRHLSSGDVSGGTHLDIGEGGAATGIRYEGTTAVVAGIRWTGLAPFLLTLSGSSASEALLVGPDLQTNGFLPTPLLSAGATFRTALQGPGSSVVELPFDLRPEARCLTSTAPVATSPVVDSTSALTVTRGAVTLSGGMVSLRSSAISVSAAASCE